MCKCVDEVSILYLSIHAFSEVVGCIEELEQTSSFWDIL